MLLVSGYLRTALLWAMIPLTVFASRPAMGCTCASGEYKFVCVAHLSRGPVSHGSNEKGVTGQKACCEQETHSSDSAPCCEQGDCALAEGQGKAAGHKCCNPDSLTVGTVASAVSYSLDNEHHGLFDLPVPESVWHVGNLVIDGFVPNDTGPPGGNLIVSLRRLLI